MAALSGRVLPPRQMAPSSAVHPSHVRSVFTPWFRTLAVLVAALSLTGTARLAGAEKPSFRAEVDATRVGVEDTFTLVITIEGRSIDLKGEITTPDLSNLQIVGGPSLSTRMSFINGAISQARQYTLLLRAIEVGPARIGPVHARLGNTDRSTAPIELEVAAGRLAQARPRPVDPFDVLRQDDPFDSMFGRQRPEPQQVKILLTAEANRSRVFVGEPLLLTFYLYTQAAISGIELEQPPVFPGFWSEELPQKEEQPQGERAQRDGEPYQRFVVLQRLLYPTRAGDLEIPAAGFRLGIPQRGGFFDPAFGRTSVVTRRTEPVRIHVEALPSEPGFAGAVGKLRAQATLDRAAVAVGEAATLRFRVQGTGNLRWIDKAPEVSIPGVRVYPPQVSTEVKASSAGLSGARSWEFVLIPETAGTHRIPPLPFTYLDTSSRKLVHTETTPLVLAAGHAGEATASSGKISTTPAAAGAVASELRLRDALEPRRHLLPRVGLGAVIVALGLALLVHALIWGWPRGGISVIEARAGTSRARSARRALAELRQVARGKVSKEAAAIQVEQAIQDLFGVIEERPAEGDSERDRELKEILQEARFVRYAPQLGEYSDKLRDIARRAVTAVRRWA